MDAKDHDADLEKSIPYKVLEAITEVKTKDVNINHAIWVIDKIISV